MIDRRGAIRFVLAALGGASLSPAALSQQSFQRFIPLLVDVPGWRGLAPTGRAGAGGSVITATRTYSRGEARFVASVLSGTASLAGNKRSPKAPIDGAHKTSTIDGFQVTTLSTQPFILVAVALGPRADFSLLFSNVSPGQAMALARKFDWKAIQALTQ